MCAQRLVDEIAAHKHHLQVRPGLCGLQGVAAAWPPSTAIVKARTGLDRAQRLPACPAACAPLPSLRTGPESSEHGTPFVVPPACLTRPQDAAQYALGNLMAVVLGDARVPPQQRQRHVTRLLEELRNTSTPGQCQGEPWARASWHVAWP